MNKNNIEIINKNYGDIFNSPAHKEITEVYEEEDEKDKNIFEFIINLFKRNWIIIKYVITILLILFMLIYILNSKLNSNVKNKSSNIIESINQRLNIFKIFDNIDKSFNPDYFLYIIFGLIIYSITIITLFSFGVLIRYRSSIQFFHSTLFGGRGMILLIIDLGYKLIWLYLLKGIWTIFYNVMKSFKKGINIVNNKFDGVISDNNKLFKIFKKKKIINTDDLNSSSDDSIYNTKTDSSTSTFIN